MKQTRPALRPWLLAAVLALPGCAQTGLGYYWQSLSGHIALLQAAQPVQTWLDQPDTPPQLRQRLQLAQRIRSFAVTDLALPDNPSYQRYAQLPRSAAVWNVVAAPPWSLQLHPWCFPVTGCIGYKGYFDQADAQAQAASLRQQGLEVAVYPVPAYSTLGYSNWLGGDPLLSTFIHWPEGDLVRLLLHELAHQMAYASGDTAFNESYATAVERLGVAHWLQHQASAPVRQAYALAEQRRTQWRALTQQTRAALAQIYEENPAQTPIPPALLAIKNEVLSSFRADYAQLRQQWLAQGQAAQQLQALDDWVRQANNASFGAQAVYDDWVPAFMQLFAQQGQDWPGFHAAVQALAKMPQEARLAAMQQLLDQGQLRQQVD